MRPRLAYPIATLSGALLTLAFPEPSLSFLAWLALAPLLFVTTGTAARRGALLWAAFGFGFLGTLLSWVSIAGWVAWGVLLVVEIPFIAAFGALWAWLSGKTGPFGRIALAAGAWAAVEYLRSVFPIGGFTWGQLAQSQHDMGWVLRWASIGGGVFLAGLIAGVNGSLAEIVRAVRDRRVAPRDVGAVAAPVLFLIVFFGAPLGIRVHFPFGQPVRVAVVQGNVDPTEPETLEKQYRILQSHVHLTEEIGDLSVERPAMDALVIWPESSVSIDPDLTEVQESLAIAATAVNSPMIVGGNEDVDADHYQVSAFLVSPEGEIVDRYRKTHLVPFGEYVPARDLLDWLPILDQVPRDAIPGNEGKLFSVAGQKVAPVISFEGDFGSLVRGRVVAGAKMIVVATNTSTWLNSWASAQHVAFSQVRAVENGVPVVHSAISGISAIIGADGSVRDSLPLYEPGTMVQVMRFGTSITPYARYGDWLLLLGIVLCAVVWWRSRRWLQRLASPDA